MSCVKCQSTLLRQDNVVRYSCGHCYHIACILKTKLSIYKPTCPACNKGNLICNRLKEKEIENENEDEDEGDDEDQKEKDKKKERGPQFIHYLIALILISLTVSYLVF